MHSQQHTEPKATVKYCSTPHQYYSFMAKYATSMYIRTYLIGSSGICIEWKLTRNGYQEITIFHILLLLLLLLVYLIKLLMKKEVVGVCSRNTQQRKPPTHTHGVGRLEERSGRVLSRLAGFWLPQDNIYYVVRWIW